MARASARTTNALFSGAAVGAEVARCAGAAGTVAITIAVGAPACCTLLSVGCAVASACEREPQARATAPARSSGTRMRVFIVKTRRIDTGREWAGVRSHIQPGMNLSTAGRMYSLSGHTEVVIPDTLASSTQIFGIRSVWGLDSLAKN